MSDFRFFVILAPFLQLAVTSNLQRHQPWQRLGQFLPEFCVRVQDLAGFDHPGKEGRCDFDVHGG